jgi:hypothetical protein
MNADTRQNTVFPLTVAPETVSEPPKRCEEGARIIREWARAVNKAPMGEWEAVMGGGYVVYIRHWMQCTECGLYELNRHAVKAEGEQNER